MYRYIKKNWVNWQRILCLKIVTTLQCCGSVTFWYGSGCGSGSSDPYLCLTDLDADPGGPKTYGSYESGSGCGSTTLLSSKKYGLDPGPKIRKKLIPDPGSRGLTVKKVWNIILVFILWLWDWPHRWGSWGWGRSSPWSRRGRRRGPASFCGSSACASEPEQSTVLQIFQKYCTVKYFIKKMWWWSNLQFDGR